MKFTKVHEHCMTLNKHFLKAIWFMYSSITIMRNFSTAYQNTLTDTT